MYREDLIKILRRSQTIISILLFLIVFFVCWWSTNLDIREIQLSNWGKGGWIAKIWNSAVCIFSISIFINSFLYLNNNHRIKYKLIFYALFGILSICLFLVGFFNIDWVLTHNISACLYFFFYPLNIFLFSYFNRKYLSYKDWREKLIISISMAIIPMLLMMMFNGMAIAEIAHTSIVILFNIKLSLCD